MVFSEAYRTLLNLTFRSNSFINGSILNMTKSQTQIIQRNVRDLLEWRTCCPEKHNIRAEVTLGSDATCDI